MAYVLIKWDAHKYGESDWASWHTDTHNTHKHDGLFLFPSKFFASITRRIVFPARNAFINTIQKHAQLTSWFLCTNVQHIHRKAHAHHSMSVHMERPNTLTSSTVPVPYTTQNSFGQATHRKRYPISHCAVPFRSVYLPKLHHTRGGHRNGNLSMNHMYQRAVWRVFDSETTELV